MKKVKADKESAQRLYEKDKSSSTLASVALLQAELYAIVKILNSWELNYFCESNPKKIGIFGLE